MSLVGGLKNRASVQLRAIASLACGWSFRNPVLIGHRIDTTITVLRKRATLNPARGILTLGFGVRTQSGALAQKGTNQ